MNRNLCYDLIYALAAKDGRDAALFGDSFVLSREAFQRSLAGPAFPELWFEIPLKGDPWFDFHALMASKGLPQDVSFTEEETGGNLAAFEWFARTRQDLRQLALSWDTSRGDVDHPAIQLLTYRRNDQMVYEFLEAAGRPDAVPAHRAFVSNLPEDWFPCYTGVFPGRPGHNLRVECVLEGEVQRAYAEDPALLEAHLRQVGMDYLGETVVERCQLLAQAPFALEFQFDIEPDGRPGKTFSASLRFAQPSGSDGDEAFTLDGAAGELMSQVEAWGLADERWRLLEDTIVCSRLKRGDENVVLFCYPAFLKLRWHDGAPFDAKAYLIAGME